MWLRKHVHVHLIVVFFFLHTYWLLIPELYCSFCYPQVYYIYVFFIEGFSTDETEAKVGHWDYFITW